MLESGPLSGLRVVVTRPRGQAEAMMRHLRRLGAQPIEFPSIRIRPTADFSALDEALRRLPSFHWVVFTSVNAVEATISRMAQIGVPIDSLAARRVAAIGPKTAQALVVRGVTPTFVPREFVAEQIVDGLGDVTGMAILLPRAAEAREILPETLARRGASVTVIPIYQTEPADPDPIALEQLRQGVDVITFTSPSTIRGFSTLVKKAGLDLHQLPGHPLVACIGPITAEAARALGCPATIIATEYTSDGLTEALQEHFRGGSAR